MYYHLWVNLHHAYVHTKNSGTCEVGHLAANGGGAADNKRSVTWVRIVCERYRVEIREAQGMFTR